MDIAERAVAAIDREELASLAVDLGAIESPAGREGPAADRVEEWLAEQGFSPRRIALVPDRPTIMARVRGTGNGPTLVFNAHLDTAISRYDTLVYDDPAQARYISAWREGDVLYGNGLVNDKAPMAAFLIAAAAIVRSGVQLAGDLVLTAVPGEIGLEPMDEFPSPDYLGKDLGTRYAISHGAVGDAALVAEATGNALAWVMAGKAYFKITVFGGEPLYTPFTPLETSLVKHPNAIVRSAAAVEALTNWAAEYGRRVYECPGGTVAPRATIGALRSGHPGKITKSTQVAFLYFDVRLRPDASVTAIEKELRSALRNADVDADVDCVLFRRGYEAQNIQPLADAVLQAHRAEFDDEPPRPAPPVCSMWRDTNPYNEVGIPSLTYGPAASTGGGNYCLSVDQLLTTSRVYARAAIGFCGTCGTP